MDKLSCLKKELESAKNPKKAKLLQKFFKTAPGEYGHGDIFLGIMVPIQRKICQNYTNINLSDIQKLLNSKVHEHRFCALVLLVKKYQRSGEKEKKEIFNFYIKNSKKINNWDLVDTSTPQIIGDFLITRDRKILYKLAKSKNIWQRRIAVLATVAFIRKNDFKEILKISKILLQDKHDLIHKAAGWMLREVGKRNKTVLINFLEKHSAKMPRVMLRYAIEKFKNSQKLYFLNR